MKTEENTLSLLFKSDGASTTVKINGTPYYCKFDSDLENAVKDFVRHYKGYKSFIETRAKYKVNSK